MGTMVESLFGVGGLVGDEKKEKYAGEVMPERRLTTTSEVGVGEGVSRRKCGGRRSWSGIEGGFNSTLLTVLWCGEVGGRVRPEGSTALAYRSGSNTGLPPHSSTFTHSAANFP